MTSRINSSGSASNAETCPPICGGAAMVQESGRVTGRPIGEEIRRPGRPTTTPIPADAEKAVPNGTFCVLSES